MTSAVGDGREEITEGRGGGVSALAVGRSRGNGVPVGSGSGVIEMQALSTTRGTAIIEGGPSSVLPRLIPMR